MFVFDNKKTSIPARKATHIAVSMKTSGAQKMWEGFLEEELSSVAITKDEGVYKAYFENERGESLMTSKVLNPYLVLEDLSSRRVTIETEYGNIAIGFDRTECAPMHYYASHRGDSINIRCQGTYKDYDYVIFSCGRNPVAAIALSGKIADLVDPDAFPARVHGGATFVGRIDDTDTVYVGWDYGHSDDYVFGNEDEDGKKWTTEEILLEVLDAIDQLQK